MILTRKVAAVLLAALVGATATAFHVRAQPRSQTSDPAQSQQPAPSMMNPNLVFLDPAHGGPDPGATLDSHVFEKDVTLAIAERLRTTLMAAGFTVVSTREADPAAPLTDDQRAEIANQSHALACLVLHATTAGSGVHLYTSTLPPPESDADAYSPPRSSHPFVPVSWQTAQAGSVLQSLRLVADLSSALRTENLPVVTGRAPVRPLDNMMCPAVAIELAPLQSAGRDAAPVTDTEYQQRVATALTTTLMAWRDRAGPAPEHTSPTKGGEQSTGPASQTQAAARARAAAEAAGLAASRSHTPLGVQAVQTGAGVHPTVGSRATQPGGIE